MNGKPIDKRALISYGQAKRMEDFLLLRLLVTVYWIQKLDSYCRLESKEKSHQLGI